MRRRGARGEGNDASPALTGETVGEEGGRAALGPPAWTARQLLLGGGRARRVTLLARRFDRCGRLLGRGHTSVRGSFQCDGLLCRGQHSWVVKAPDSYAPHVSLPVTISTARRWEDVRAEVVLGPGYFG